MLHTLYASRDVLVGYAKPFMGANDEAVKRDFKNFLKETPNAEDYQLWKVGAYDDDTGKIETEGYPIMMEFGGDE